ncbi:SGNH/GDSL hydrolase family protein [Paenibacillus sp. GYB003]|uniref:SGNH/GDSL hydrolase family protein n=1 Tax=Paenibacillus sp. GYB003 TaxID=2994392 RepID=UPI002F9639AF
MDTGRNIPAKSIHIAFAGDSITWGDGMLDDSFVAAADQYVRTRLAATILPHELAVSGIAEKVESRKFYLGSALRFLKEGSEASFTLEGDELSIVQGIERGSRPGSLIELYVDGVLHDTFSNSNDSPCGTERLQFKGDGRSDTFDLGRCQTYGHEVTVDNEKLKGIHNTAGYGGVFPEGQDYLIIRKYALDAETNNTKVHHHIWFKNPPRNGSIIEVTQSYGENIAYAKTTVGEMETDFGSPLESRFGDGGFDNASVKHQTSLSYGMDFRETDQRAVKTWKFPTYAKRRFVLRIKGIDTNGSGEKGGDPYFIFNFATNRFHQLTNAGIGGWTARQFNTDQGLRNTFHLMEKRPDIVFIELGTNDDWDTGNEYVATRRIIVTEQQLRRMPTLFLKNCVYTGDEYYTVDTAELVVADSNANSVTINGESAELGGVRKGDVVVIGNYDGDNRNVLSRIIEHWDAATRTATFEKPLHPTPVTKTVGGFTGQVVRIKRIEGYIGQLELMIDTIQKANRDVQIALVDTGLSNFYTRLLMGYPEKLDELAKRKNVFRVHVYQALMDWQYSQPRDIQLYIGNDRAMKSTGANEYFLLSADGKDINRMHGTQLRNWSVLVDGVERYGDDCFIEGGYALAFKTTVERSDLTIADWDSHGRGRNPRMEYRFIPPKLVFTSHVPPQGATIDVKIASDKWSADDTHLNRRAGIDIYSQEIIKTLDAMLHQRAIDEKRRKDGVI